MSSPPDGKSPRRSPWAGISLVDKSLINSCIIESFPYSISLGEIVAAGREG